MGRKTKYQQKRFPKKEIQIKKIPTKKIQTKKDFQNFEAIQPV